MSRTVIKYTSFCVHVGAFAEQILVSKLPGSNGSCTFNPERKQRWDSTQLFSKLLFNKVTLLNTATVSRLKGIPKFLSCSVSIQYTLQMSGVYGKCSVLVRYEDHLHNVEVHPQKPIAPDASVIFPPNIAILTPTMQSLFIFMVCFQTFSASFHFPSQLC